MTTLNTRSAHEILADVTAVAAGQNEHSLRALFEELDLAIMGTPQLSKAAFDAMKTYLTTDAFLELEESWQLGRFIQNNWDKLSASQRADLQPELLRAYDKFSDWMGALILAEIFGKHYSDEALQLFDRASRSTAPEPRALVAHGLETLARSTGDPNVVKEAIERLQAMAKAGDEMSRTEADDALRHLRKLGKW
jgi:hypothetical protein